MKVQSIRSIRCFFLRLFPDFFLSNPLYVGNRCSPELTAESRASAAYATVTLSSGADAASFLESMAQQADDLVDETVAADLTDTTMFGTTSLLSFSGLVENVPIDAVVKVTYKYEEPNTSHIAVIGPNGFQMCSCLQVLRCGLPCRHTVAALVTELKQADEFKGESIHPRWRSSIQPWSIEGVGLSYLNDHERGPYSGGVHWGPRRHRFWRRARNQRKK